MLRETHKFFAQNIAQELDFPEQETRIFIDGSLGPDTHGDFPHNKGKNANLLHKLNTARDLYHLHDEYAYGELGNALHYIQDKWVGNSEEENQTPLLSDNDLLNLLNQLDTFNETKEEYKSILDILFFTKNKGIDSWFNHQWGIWHRDYASCVFVYTDLVELMLPTLQQNSSIINDKQKFKEYIHSESFKKATKEGLLASIFLNYKQPKLQGYPAAIYCLATIDPPANSRDKELDFNIAYRLSLEVARYSIGNQDIFKFQDGWTHKTKKKHMSLSLVIPQYHTLIPKPVHVVQQERQWNFYEDSQNFLEHWENANKTLPEVAHRSELWKQLLATLVEMLQPQ